MSDLRPKGISISLFGEKREVMFSLAVIDEIQERCNMPLYDVIAKIAAAADGSTDRDTMETYKKVIVAFLNIDNASEENEITEEYVGNKTDFLSYRENSIGILRAYGISIPDPDENDEFEEDEEEDPDTKAGTGR